MPCCVNPVDSTEVVYSSTTAPPMPGLNQTDRDEIRQMISNFRAGGMPLWIKESLALTIVMGGAGFIVARYIPAQIGSQTSTMGTDIGTLKESVGTLKTDVADIKKDIKDSLNKALDRAYPALKPSTPNKEGTNVQGAIEFENSILKLANDLRIPLGLASNRLGLNAIEVSQDPKLRKLAWDGIRLSINQRTLQEDLQALLSSKKWVEVYHDPSNRLIAEAFRGNRHYVTLEKVPFDRCALSAEIGYEDVVQRWADKHLTGLCSEFSLYVGGKVAPLDGVHFRNIIFENAHLTYKGGPLVLENVAFVNCSFELGQNPNVALLASNILQSREVAFNSRP